MKISEFAQKTGIKESTLRYYEKQGFLQVQRRNGIREFSDKDLEFAEFIKRLKVMGMPLAQIKCYADLRYQGPETVKERYGILQDHQRFLQSKIADYQTYMDNLTDKMAIYRDMMK